MKYQIHSKGPYQSNLVTLLSLNWYRNKDPRTPLGAALILSALKSDKDLKAAKIVCESINYDVRDNLSTCIHEIIMNCPAVLGIGVYAWNSVQVKAIISALRRLGYLGTIVLGGPEITYEDQEVEPEFEEADYFVKGYGEAAFLTIVKGILTGLKPIGPGIYKNGEPIEKTIALPASTMLNSPFLDDELLAHLAGEDFIRWQTQRGCVFRCTFCAFKSPDQRLFHTDLNIVRLELQKIAKTGAKNVAVLDPVFFINKKRSLAILGMIESFAPEVCFSIQTRFEHLDYDIITRLSKLRVKLECGLQTLDVNVQNRIRRINRKDKVEEAIHLLTTQGVKFETHLIYGLPEQSMSSFSNDVQFLYSMGSRNLRIFPLSLLKGTELDIENRNSSDIVFSPIFPREVLETKWMSVDHIFSIKRIQRQLEQVDGRLDDMIVHAVKELSRGRVEVIC